jgi:N-acetylglucosamine-6-phosphate deacetylase
VSAVPSTEGATHEVALDPAARIITAAAVVAGGQVLRPGWLAVVDDRVVGYGAGPAPRSTAPDRGDLDLGDHTVVPGFVDIHVHGGGGGTFGTDLGAARRAVAFHRAHGTTSTLTSLVTAGPAELLDAVSAMAELVEEGLVAGTHLEGPWLSDRRCGAHQVEELRDPDPAELSRVLRAGRGSIRMITFAPERNGGLKAIESAVQAGAVAAVGHTDGGYEITRRAVDAGATVATHLFNAMRPVHHREPGPIVALSEDDRVSLELVLDGSHIHPAIYRQVAGSAAPGRTVLVTDAMAAAGMADGAYDLGGLAVDVRSGVARLAGRDTIAGSTATMDLLFRNAAALADGTSDERLLAAVRQTSTNPASVFGWTDRDLSRGARADLVALDSDLRPSRVMIGGDWLADRDDFVISRLP